MSEETQVKKGESLPTEAFPIGNWKVQFAFPGMALEVDVLEWEMSTADASRENDWDAVRLWASKRYAREFTVSEAYQTSQYIRVAWNTLSSFFDNALESAFGITPTAGA
jgi:hypothetical protein